MLKQAKTNTSAKVVDGNLIISLPEAINPIVWRMALGEARAAALEVVSRGDENALILKTAKGGNTDIACFATKELAVDALMTVSRAMEQAEGRLKSTPARPAQTQNGTAWKWLLPLALILAALFFFSRTASMTSPAGTTAATGASVSHSAGETGVPLSADSYLSDF